MWSRRWRINLSSVYLLSCKMSTNDPRTGYYPFLQNVNHLFTHPSSCQAFPQTPSISFPSAQPLFSHIYTMAADTSHVEAALRWDNTLESEPLWPKCLDLTFTHHLCERLSATGCLWGRGQQRSSWNTSSSRLFNMSINNLTKSDQLYSSRVWTETMSFWKVPMKRIWCLSKFDSNSEKSQTHLV